MVSSALQLNPDTTILVEEGAAERYQLRGVLAPDQYNDTYYLNYKGVTGLAAYQRAIDETHYGLIYLTLTTRTGKQLQAYLDTGDTPYGKYAQVDRLLRGRVVGAWLVYVPKVSLTVAPSPATPSPERPAASGLATGAAAPTPSAAVGLEHELDGALIDECAMAPAASRSRPPVGASSPCRRVWHQIWCE